MSETLDLTTKVMVVNLSISVFSGVKVDRKVSDEVAEHHATTRHDAGSYRKQIIGKHALEPIQKIAGAARDRHYTLTLPWSDQGARLLSVTGYPAYTEAMRGLKTEFDERIHRFVVAYPELIEQARTKLNGMFDQNDYPPIDTLLERFSFQVSMSPLPSSKNWFLEMAEAELATLQQDADTRLQANIQDAVRETYRRIADCTSKMAQKLTEYAFDPSTGKVKGGIFRDSLVENVRELTDILPSLNITNDLALANITDKMRELCKFDASALREDATFRASTATTAQEIYALVEGLM